MPSLLDHHAIRGARIRARRDAIKAFQVDQAQIAKDINQIIKKLKTLPKEYERKAMKKALRPGANIIKAAAKQQILNESLFETGKLWRSIKVFSLRKSKNTLWIGPKFQRVSRGGKQFKRNEYYGGWLEFGTQTIRPRGYMRKAFTQAKEEAIQAIVKETEKILKRWIEKNKI